MLDLYFISITMMYKKCILTQYNILNASSKSSVNLELISSANLLDLFVSVEPLNAFPILSGST